VSDLLYDIYLRHMPKCGGVLTPNSDRGRSKALAGGSQRTFLPTEVQSELSMGWVDPWVGLGRVGSIFSVFGGLGRVGSNTAKVLKI